MDETEMSRKILGRKAAGPERKKAETNFLADNVLWFVSKKGCGTSVFRGPMAEALMNREDKQKAKSGVKRIESETGFVFARK